MTYPRDFCAYGHWPLSESRHLPLPIPSRPAGLICSCRLSSPVRSRGMRRVMPYTGPQNLKKEAPYARKRNPKRCTGNNPTHARPRTVPLGGMEAGRRTDGRPAGSHVLEFPGGCHVWTIGHSQMNIAPVRSTREGDNRNLFTIVNGWIHRPPPSGRVQEVPGMGSGSTH